MRTMSVRDLARRTDARLDLLQAPRRTDESHHRTLRDAVGWSYDLLSKAERTAMQRASVFAGDFDLAAAERVIGWGGLVSADVAGLLLSLADRSVLVPVSAAGETQYRMLDTIAEYAAERLDRAGDRQATTACHADHFADLATAADTGL